MLGELVDGDPGFLVDLLVEAERVIPGLQLRVEEIGPDRWRADEFEAATVGEVLAEVRAVTADWSAYEYPVHKGFQIAVGFDRERRQSRSDPIAAPKRMVCQLSSGPASDEVMELGWQWYRVMLDHLVSPAGVYRKGYAYWVSARRAGLSARMSNHELPVDYWVRRFDLVDNYGPFLFLPPEAVEVVGGLGGIGSWDVPVVVHPVRGDAAEGVALRLDCPLAEIQGHIPRWRELLAPVLPDPALIDHEIMPYVWNMVLPAEEGEVPGVDPVDDRHPYLVEFREKSTPYKAETGVVIGPETGRWRNYLVKNGELPSERRVSIAFVAPFPFAGERFVSEVGGITGVWEGTDLLDVEVRRMGLSVWNGFDTCDDRLVGYGSDAFKDRAPHCGFPGRQSVFLHYVESKLQVRFTGETGEFIEISVSSGGKRVVRRNLKQFEQALALVDRLATGPKPDLDTWNDAETAREQLREMLELTQLPKLEDALYLR